MPREMNFSGTGYESPPGVHFGSFEKGHQLENGNCRPRRKCSSLEDDEGLKYLSHEEKDVLLFFEETIDSLEEDLEEQALHDSGVFCSSLKLLEENPSSHPESEDIVDLVPSALEDIMEPVLEGIWKLDEPEVELIEPPGNNTCVDSVSPQPTWPSAPPLPISELYPVQPAVLHPKLVRSLPTPLVIAQKMYEQPAEESSSSPASPDNRKVNTKRIILASSSPHGGGSIKPSGSPPTAPKPQRFPSNISFTNASEKEFSKIISKAAVSVQERKAQVLANVNNSTFLISPLDERLQNHGLPGHGRSSSLGDVPSEQARNKTISSLSLIEEVLARAQQTHRLNLSMPKDEGSEFGPIVANGYRSIQDILERDPNLFPSLSKPVATRSEVGLVDSTSAQPNTTKNVSTHPQQDLSLATRRRSGSLPKSSGLHPKGVTVQFSGRGSTEEARREALRKLGLLKE